MKKEIDTIMTIIILMCFVALMALGLWFLQGGDLRDLLKGCYDSKGCD